MSVHTMHPDSHEHGLADDCPRCAEHAEDPFAFLDDRNLTLLAERTVLWMQDVGDSLPRSVVEQVAMRQVEHVLVRARRLRELGVIA